MSEPTPIFLEYRFPLGLDPVIPTIRALYDTSKEQCWDPQADIDWDRFERAAWSEELIAAARLTWSHRAWVEYTALAETPSLLVRFCVERGREADPKFYLTVRNTEEAWHIECCHRYAELAGGYVEQPNEALYAQNLNRSFHREVLHAETPLDAYVAAHCALSDSLEMALWEGYASNATEPVASAVLERCLADKRRHAHFGWLYLEARHTHWSPDEREQIANYVQQYVDEVELTGYHCVSLGTGADAADIAKADACCAHAGLGALDPAEERTITRASLQASYTRLNAMDLPLGLEKLDRIPA